MLEITSTDGVTVRARYTESQAQTHAFVRVIGPWLVIVPGIIASLGFYLAPYYLVDARLGPIGAMKATTSGHGVMKKPVSTWLRSRMSSK